MKHFLRQQISGDVFLEEMLPSSLYSVALLGSLKPKFVASKLITRLSHVASIASFSLEGMFPFFDPCPFSPNDSALLSEELWWKVAKDTICQMPLLSLPLPPLKLLLINTEILAKSDKVKKGGNRGKGERMIKPETILNNKLVQCFCENFSFIWMSLYLILCIIFILYP